MRWFHITSNVYLNLFFIMFVRTVTNRKAFQVPSFLYLQRKKNLWDCSLESCINTTSIYEKCCGLLISYNFLSPRSHWSGKDSHEKNQYKIDTMAFSLGIVQSVNTTTMGSCIRNQDRKRLTLQSLSILIFPAFLGMSSFIHTFLFHTCHTFC